MPPWPHSNWDCSSLDVTVIHIAGVQMQLETALSCAQGLHGGPGAGGLPGPPLLPPAHLSVHPIIRLNVLPQRLKSRPQQLATRQDITAVCSAVAPLLPLYCCQELLRCAAHHHAAAAVAATATAAIAAAACAAAAAAAGTGTCY